jgi:sugar lactone lactonase YvrE
MPSRIASIAALLCGLSAIAHSQQPAPSTLRDRVEATPTLQFEASHLVAQPPHDGWESGAVSWVALGADGLIYELQRGERADPILVLDRTGRVLRSWGAGDFKLPHSVRLDPTGNVWTVDASSSQLIKYSPSGKKLFTISVAEQPDTGSPFNGTTDVAFAKNGHLFITDGYGNARVLEYSASGKRLHQWGTAGDGPGQFNLPHALQIAEDGTIYVADRENGRIESFNQHGRYLNEISGLGRVYALKLAGDALWASIAPSDQPVGSPGWLVKLDRRSGRMLGHLELREARTGHAVELSSDGEPVATTDNGLLWFRALH